jgi:hypothetical protein
MRRLQPEIAVEISQHHRGRVSHRRIDRRRAEGAIPTIEKNAHIGAVAIRDDDVDVDVDVDVEILVDVPRAMACGDIPTAR